MVSAAALSPAKATPEGIAKAMKLAAPAVARIAMQALLVKRPAFLMLDHASFVVKLLQV